MNIVNFVSNFFMNHHLLKLDINNNFIKGILIISLIYTCILFIFTFGGFEKNRNHYQLKALFSDVNGLETGTPVILNGVKVGEVKEIYIENEKVTVILSINKLF